MFIRKMRLRDLFNKSSAVILSLLILISIVTPLCVGMSNASAVSGAKFHPGYTYYFYLGDAPESFIAAAEDPSTAITARFVSGTGEVIAAANLVKTTSADNGTVNSNISKYVYKVTMPTTYNGKTTTNADAVYIRDLGVIPSTLTASPQNHVRLIFDAEQVDDLENPGFVTFDTPLISARDSRGNALTISDNGTNIITPYDPENGAYGAPMSDYELQGNDKSKFWWYVDIPENQFAQIASVTFYSLTSTKNGVQSGAVVTQALEPIRYGDFVFFRGTIPVDPHIYKFEASDSSFTDTVTNGKYQNYFMVTEESEMTVSKYTYPERFSSVASKDVWVYNESWAGLEEVYASGDYNDPLNGTTSFTEDPTGSGWFKGSIPEGAAVRFHPMKDNDERGASDITSYPSGYTTPAYYMSNDYADQWIEKSKAEEVYDYYAAPGTGFSSSDIYSVKATYYDYLSNQEMDNGWRQNLPSLWSGDIWNGGDWGNREEFANQFSNFNNEVMKVAQAHNSWRYPLYFGNFATIDGEHNKNGFLTPYWLDVASDTNMSWNKFYSVQNSYPFGGNGTKSTAAVWGLMYPELTKNYFGDRNGAFSYDIKVGNSGATTAPYFDAEWLINNTDGESSGGGSTSSTTTYTISVSKVEYSGNTRYYTIKIPKEFETIQFSINGNDNVSTDFANNKQKSIATLANNHTKIGYYNNSGGQGLFEGSDSRSYSGSDGYNYILIEDQTGGDDLCVHVYNNSGLTTDWPGLHINKGQGESITITSTTSSGSTSNSGRRGYVVSSYFPFRTVTENGVTHYRFNSSDSDSASARGDVVNFTWENGVPKKVNYYNNTNKIRNAYNSEDRYNNTGTKVTSTSYGFYPFNTGDSSTWVKESNHDFGFATKMEMNFRLPQNGKYTTSSGGTENAMFTFTGDDDLWVYIDGQLVLDLGGAHSKASGSINFGYGTNTIEATTSLLGLQVNVNNSTTDNDYISNPLSNQKKRFTINNTDTTQTHTMTIYYMERGLMDSNLSIDFSTMPANTAVRVEKNVESENLNDGMAYAYADGKYASRKDTFNFALNRGTSSSNITGSTTGFRYYLTDNAIQSGESAGIVEDNTVGLKDNQYVRFLNQFYANDYIRVVETLPSNGFNYTTKVEVYDSSGVTIDSTKSNNGRQVDFKLDGEGKNTATAIVEYTNTPETTDLVVSTDIIDKDTGKIVKNADARRFTFRLEVEVEPNVWKGLPFDADMYLYTLSAAGDGSLEPLTQNGSRVYYETALSSDDGSFTLSKYNKLIIHDLPVNLNYRITEVRDALYAPEGYFVDEIYDETNRSAEEVFTGSFTSNVITLHSNINALSTTPNGTAIVTPEDGISAANSVEIINVYSPGGATVSAQKLLDGVKYSGEAGKFQFTAELVGGHISGLATGDRDINPATDTKYEFSPKQVGVSANGDITWSSASDTFDYLGDYIYKISEVDDGSDTTYTYDTTVYYALVQNNGDGDPVVTYYKTYSGSGGASGLSNKIASPDSLTDGVVFRNNTNIAYADVSFTKQDTSGNPLAGVQFTLYTDANCTTAGTKGTAIGGSVVSTKTEGTTFTNPATSAQGTGLVTFSGLDYQPGTNTSTPDKTYYIKETKTVPGYQLDTGIYKLEIFANGSYKLSYKALGSSGYTEVSNNTVVNYPQPELPKTGGIGVGIYYVFGAVIVMIGILAFICYKKRESYLRFK